MEDLKPVEQLLLMILRRLFFHLYDRNWLKAFLRLSQIDRIHTCISFAMPSTLEFCTTPVLCPVGYELMWQRRLGKPIGCDTRLSSCDLLGGRYGALITIYIWTCLRIGQQSGFYQVFKYHHHHHTFNLCWTLSWALDFLQHRLSVVSHGHCYLVRYQAQRLLLMNSLHDLFGLPWSLLPSANSCRHFLIQMVILYICVVQRILVWWVIDLMVSRWGIYSLSYWI